LDRGEKGREGERKGKEVEGGEEEG